MAYSTGILNKRVTILNVPADGSAEWGKNPKHEAVATVWANVTWNKGVKALREGALDAYDTVLIRMRWNDFATRNSRYECDGVTYQVQSFHSDKQANTIQITATEIVK